MASPGAWLETACILVSTPARKSRKALNPAHVRRETLKAIPEGCSDYCDQIERF
ncbi:hypothetical protein PtA15_5A231 [Puccinia triticina]|uniref:Uncharacterized protein n=1 Tax=Puccinia triticina TaxID=208348 RepID=A0ABY7CJY0_9BASI|nr:uncharacterized protein PtA15_5A231 [Puccinia triticina]WAQ84658.1 hypothetical protein PtA15_5A231 [Puccinia triticina]